MLTLAEARLAAYGFTFSIVFTAVLFNASLMSLVPVVLVPLAVLSWATYIKQKRVARKFEEAFFN